MTAWEGSTYIVENTGFSSYPINKAKYLIGGLIKVDYNAKIDLNDVRGSMFFCGFKLRQNEMIKAVSTVESDFTLSKIQRLG